MNRNIFEICSTGIFEAPQLTIEPFNELTLPVKTQQSIIEGVNERLRNHPRQSFLFYGRPGAGKTYLVKALYSAIHKSKLENKARVESLDRDDPRKAVLKYADGAPHQYAAESRTRLSGLLTLSEWREAQFERMRPGFYPSTPLQKRVEPFTRNAIQAVRNYNENRSRDINARLGLDNEAVYPLNTLHLFLDELDEMPSATENAAVAFRGFINSVYDNAFRGREGNTSDHVQLITAMNGSWQDFCKRHGDVIARRLWEICVRVDMGEGRFFDPPQSSKRSQFDRHDAVIDRLLSA